jgi:V8-like Glu-specific endopeptidase
MGRDELARALAPVALVGEYEYRLAEPDRITADEVLNILASGKVPQTEGQRPALAPTLSGAGDVRPQYLFDPLWNRINEGASGDDRSWVSLSQSAAPLAAAHAYIHNQTCTATLIGRMVAITAAHCLYNPGVGWRTIDWLAFGLNNADSMWPSGSSDFPFGTRTAQYYVPSEWKTAGNWDYDFAVINVMGSTYIGDHTGWFGTQNSISGTQTIVGYPSDKWDTQWLSQWVSTGDYWYQTGSRYTHHIDIVSGHSGAGIYKWGGTPDSNGCPLCGSWYVTSVQSSNWCSTQSPSVCWNEARKWDAVTYAVFDTNGQFWP